MNLSALDHACVRLNTETIKELIMSGCKCGSSTPFGLHSPLKSLILNKEYTLARMLIETGLDLSNEKWIFDNLKNVDGDNETQHFYKWLGNYRKTPSTLLNFSRVKIRSLLNCESLETKINTLRIPKFLKDYLMMKY
jgi:hypothetical protein